MRENYDGEKGTYTETCRLSRSLRYEVQRDVYK